MIRIEECNVAKRTIKPFENKFIIGDCEDILKNFPAKSVDLVLTSPPYADQRNYGSENSSISPDDYIKWFAPKARQIFRVLQENGSFILNLKKKKKNILAVS